MKDQKHNEGELKKLTVEIEKKVVESMEYMAENTTYSKDELVVIALKRFISHHADYMDVTPKIDVD